jgi:hypothetical protein
MRAEPGYKDGWAIVVEMVKVERGVGRVGEWKVGIAENIRMWRMGDGIKWCCSDSDYFTILCATLSVTYLGSLAKCVPLVRLDRHLLLDIQSTKMAADGSDPFYLR